MADDTVSPVDIPDPADSPPPTRRWWHKAGSERADRAPWSQNGVVVIVAELCRAAGVRVYSVHNQHRHRGDCRQMITIGEIPQLVDYLLRQYELTSPLRFDRASLAVWFAGVEAEVKLLNRRKLRLSSPWGYERRLEMEVHRIALLEEPARTVEATEFMERVKDAVTLAGAVKRLGQRKSRVWAGQTRHPEGKRWWEKLARMAEGKGDQADASV